MCNFALHARNVQTKSSALLTSYVLNDDHDPMAHQLLLRRKTILKKKKSSRRTDLFFIISGGSRKCVYIRCMGKIMLTNTKIQTHTSIQFQRSRQKYGIEQMRRFTGVASFHISFYHISWSNIFILLVVLKRFQFSTLNSCLIPKKKINYKNTFYIKKKHFIDKALNTNI